MGRVVITVTIETDGDARVSVGGTPINTPQSASPPAELEDAPWPTSSAEPATAGGVCPVHHLPWKIVPGGVSKKTGKAYLPFQACPEFGCNEKPR